MTDRPTGDERERWIAEGRDGALEPDQAPEVGLLADLLADPSTWADPDTGLEDTIVRAVADAQPAPARRLPQRDSGARHTRATHRRRMMLPALAAAATVLIIAVAAVTTLRGDTSRDFDVALSGTELAEAASGTGELTRSDSGFRITLDAQGLTPLPTNEYYQAWLRNAAGILVPIGSFSSSDDRVTLWSGVDPAEYSTMTVTIEAADNDQTSSGRRVLQGDVRAD
jgi:hypothetical protein